MTRVLVGLISLAAIIGALAGDDIPLKLLPLVLVVLGLVYGAMVVDAEDATGFLAVAIAVGAAASANALSSVAIGDFNMIGTFLDGVLDQMSTALYGGVASVLAVRAWNRLKSE